MHATMSEEIAYPHNPTTDGDTHAIRPWCRILDFVFYKCPTYHHTATHQLDSPPPTPQHLYIKSLRDPMYT